MPKKPEIVSAIVIAMMRPHVWQHSGRTNKQMPFLVGFGDLDRVEKRIYSRIADAALFAQLAQCRLPNILFRLYGAF
jgi:hypothetical protein